MKSIAFILLPGVILVACEQAPKADKASATNAQTVTAATGNAYLADTAACLIEWIGTKPTGQHRGTLRLAGGAIYVKDSLITGGQLVINMYTLQNIDLASDTAMKNKLERELKSSSFFDIEKFPTATFDITAVNAYHPAVGEEVALKGATHLISGNLTLKSVVKNISFPARVHIDKHQLTAVANFNIDRTLWGINYRADKSLQDKLINSQVNIGFHISASR
ncbi:YceI family protein [Chitinophaga qingshengii]|uniref:YceI family protein n=1 Tax=Chitinophaga qingshengii TaxID=1569794 RepID=A0ABR7TW83_9BACT|nr:YceI family protein [Chitinophaga qingshengii]MBC9933868.1 YceI family protein [Chitinophaga qingshengii]